MTQATDSDPVTACLAEVRERWDTAENAVYSTLLGRAQALVSLADVPRLLGAVEAVLARHKPFRWVVLGEVCSRHENHPFFSITAPGAADVDACPSCTATVYVSCSACGGSIPLDRCPERLAIARELLGERSTGDDKA